MLKYARDYMDQWLARRAVVKLLSPYLARTRANIGTIPEIAWRDPYIVGFLTMLGSLVLIERSRGRISGEKLGLAQLAVWESITGLKDSRVGEDILMLSASGDEDFLEGCRNARRFLAVSFGEGDLDDTEFLAELLASPQWNVNDRPAVEPHGNPLTPWLWDLLFERRLQKFTAT